MNDDARKPDKHLTLRGWHVALAICVVLAGLLSLHFVLRHNNVERRLTALRAAGYPTTFDELADHMKLPEGATNAAGVYEDAFAAFVLPADEARVPTLGLANWPARGAPLPERTARTVAACLTANQQCLTLLHQAAGIEHCRYDYDYAQKDMGPGVEQFGHCVRLLRVAATYHAYKGETEAAVTCLEDSLRLCDSLEREPALAGHVARLSSTGAALGGFEHIMNLASLNDRQLRQLDAALARTACTLDFTRVLVTERCRLIAKCRDPTGFSRDPVWDWVLNKVLGVRGTGLADTLKYMEARIKASSLPPVDRVKRFRAIHNEVERLSFLHMIARVTNSSIADAAASDLRIRIRLDLARTALAVEHYRLATGVVPERLEQLVPQYLKQIPIDPFDGQPIRYRRATIGYLLYSVEADGQDNGGRRQRWVDGDDDRERPWDASDALYDLPFLVAR